MGTGEQGDNAEVTMPCRRPAPNAAAQLESRRICTCFPVPGQRASSPGAARLDKRALRSGRRQAPRRQSILFVEDDQKIAVRGYGEVTNGDERADCAEDAAVVPHHYQTDVLR